jgi:hypothetical protein
MPFWKAAAAKALRNGELMKGSSQEGPGLSSWSRSSGISTSPDTSDNTWEVTWRCGLGNMDALVLTRTQ